MLVWASRVDTCGGLGMEGMDYGIGFWEDSVDLDLDEAR